MDVKPTSGAKGESAYPSQLKTEEKRIGYNAHTKEFTKLGKADQKKLAENKEMTAHVADAAPSSISPFVRASYDYSFKGKVLDTKTDEVDVFFAGNSDRFDSFISSVQDAQSSI